LQLVLFLVPPKRRFLQEPHGVTTQKTPFFGGYILSGALQTRNTSVFIIMIGLKSTRITPWQYQTKFDRTKVR
jgi:hypothetical protein